MCITGTAMQAASTAATMTAQPTRTLRVCPLAGTPSTAATQASSEKPKMISAVTQSNATIFDTPVMCSLSTTAVRSTTAIDALASSHAAK